MAGVTRQAGALVSPAAEMIVRAVDRTFSGPAYELAHVLGGMSSAWWFSIGDQVGVLPTEAVIDQVVECYRERAKHDEERRLARKGP